MTQTWLRTMNEDDKAGTMVTWLAGLGDALIGTCAELSPDHFYITVKHKSRKGTLDCLSLLFFSKELLLRSNFRLYGNEPDFSFTGCVYENTKGPVGVIFDGKPEFGTIGGKAERAAMLFRLKTISTFELNDAA